MAESTLFEEALKKAMAECSHRELSISEMSYRLQSWSVGKEDAEKIIRILTEENFINESRYAAAFVNDKFNYNKWGKVKIAAHLRAKSIPGDIVRTALDSIDDEVYKKTISDLLTAHRRSVKAKNKYDLKSKLLRYGLSKGFESSLMYDLLNDLED
jgi:regulatory protein